MREHYLEKLRQLHNELMEMGMLCEKAISLTYKLLITEDNREENAEEIDHLAEEINAMEQEVESVCIQLLLQQQPVASDLRYISAVMKMITDLERIGDQATDISEIVLTGSIVVPVRESVVTQMAEFAIEMVNHGVEAYVNRDLQLARSVIESDDAQDSKFIKARDMLKECNGGACTAEQAMDLLMVAKYYERISDHATRIGEWVEFSLTGIHRRGRNVNNVFSSQNK